MRRLLAAAGASGLDTGPPVSLQYPLDLAGRVGLAATLPVDDGSGARAVTSGSGCGAGLDVVAVPGGTYARALHVGPHETLPLTYRGLLVTLHRQGVAAAGPVVERYLDDPAATPASRLRTEVLHRLP